jgi:hypothetical protein
LATALEQQIGLYRDRQSRFLHGADQASDHGILGDANANLENLAGRWRFGYVNPAGRTTSNELNSKACRNN